MYHIIKITSRGCILCNPYLPLHSNTKTNKIKIISKNLRIKFEKNSKIKIND